MSIYKMENPPANLGKKWSDEEVQALLQAVKRGETQAQIAEKHQRTVGGIRGRLKQLAADYYHNDNRPIQEIMKFTGLDLETISDAIAKRQYEVDLKQKNQVTKPAVSISTMAANQASVPKKDEMISLLTEIRDLMKEMVELQRDISRK
jgi:hypothetical protein